MDSVPVARQRPRRTPGSRSCIIPAGAGCRDGPTDPISAGCLTLPTTSKVAR